VVSIGRAVVCNFRYSRWISCFRLRRFCLLFCPSLYRAAENELGNMQRPGPVEQHVADADALGELQDTDLCEDCDEVLPDFFCNVCQCSLCGDCWDRQPAHRRKRLAPGQIPHEKTELLLANRIQNVFSFSGDARTFERLHKDDEITAWFGMLSPNLLISPGDR